MVREFGTFPKGEWNMQLSFKMIILSLVLFFSEVCVTLDAANNRNLYLEDDDSEGEHLDGAISAFSSRWIESPEA